MATHTFNETKFFFEAGVLPLSTMFMAQSTLFPCFFLFFL